MADRSLANFSSSAIPPAPSFADFRFSTIGQEPLLLKRISAQTPDLQYNGSSCPSSAAPAELEYPSTEPPRLLSRPTLIQSLAYSNPSGVKLPNMTMSNTRPTYQTADAHETRSAELPRLSHHQIPACSQHTSSGSSTVPAPLDAMAGSIATSSSPVLSSSHEKQTSMSISPSETPMYAAPITQRQTSLPATSPSFEPRVHQTHSSCAALRALQTRLVTSLSKLHPPDMTDALRRVQSANSHSVNALTTSHRSHILAQQSLATAQEAVAAAQESLSAAEQARTHANDALTAIRQLHSGKAGFDAEGSSDWQWKVNYIQLQDDLRILGEWIVEKENEDAKSRDVDRQDAPAGDRKMAETVKSPIGVFGFDPRAVRDISSEIASQGGETQARTSAEAPRVTPSPDLIQHRNLDHRKSLELEAGPATKTWSSEQSHASRDLLPVITDVVPMEVEGDLAEYLPPKADGETLQARQPAPTNEEPRSSAQPKDETRLHLQYERQPHPHEAHEKNLEAVKFQTTQQEERVTIEELSENAVNDSRFKPQKNPITNGSADKPQSPQSSIIVEDASRALQVHKVQEAAPTEQPEQNRAEARRLLEERNQRELVELKKEEELTAAKEQKLMAEQEKRRQEVMVQKQRATAETAARINAERARERERSMATSLHPPTSSTPHSTLQDRPVDSGNFAVKKTTISKPIKKPMSFSGSVTLGLATDGQPQPPSISDSLPPSSALARSAVLGLRQLKAKEPSPITHNVSSRKATPTEKSSQNLNVATLQAPTLTNDMNGPGDPETYRHSDDPGNLCVVPRSQISPASPEAQAVNLRFVKDRNGIRRDASTLLDLEPRSDSGYTDQPALHQNLPIPVKKESPIPAPLDGSQTRPLTEPEPPGSADPSPSCSLPANPYPLASLSSKKKYPAADRTALMDQRGVTGTNEAAPVPSTVVPPLLNAIDTPSAAPPSNTWRPPSNTMPANPHRDNLSPSRNSSKSLLASKILNAPLTTLLPELDMTVIDPISPDDSAQIAPVIHANGGWDRPVDEEVYSDGSRIREMTPPQRPRKLRRGGDHYSPPPRAPTPKPYTSRGYPTRSISPIARSLPSPTQRSPVLGKRRQREDVQEDDHPPCRQWPADRTHRTRSPTSHLRQLTQWRPDSPDRPALQARMQVTDHSSMSRARQPPSRELAWRSPSPDRPALQARIGVRDPVVRTSDQSYRPTYSSDIYKRPQFRTCDIYQSGQVDQPIAGHRLTAEPELRGPSYGRGRVDTNSNWASPRGRGNRGGNRPLNLEQRISTSTKPLTLINRLENSLRN